MGFDSIPETFVNKKLKFSVEIFLAGYGSSADDLILWAQRLSLLAVWQ